MWIVSGKQSKIRYAEAQTIGAAQRALTRVAKEQYIMESLLELIEVCSKCRRRCGCYEKKS